MSLLITADWFPVGKEGFFRKTDLYNMSWAGGIDVDNMLICAAQFGGPIAVVRDRKKLVKVQVTAKPVITIYSSSGEKLSAILWNSGQLVHMGWSSEEQLLCVKNDGQVLVYDLFGTLMSIFSMGEEASVTKIVEAKTFPSSAGTGLAVLTTKCRVFIVNSVTDPKVRQFPPLPKALLKGTPSGWELVSERNTSVIICTGKELILLRQDETPTSLHPEFREECTGFIDMAVSLDNKHIALLTDTGVLWLGSSDMKRKYCQVNTNCTSRPRQIVWCGADAVVGCWSHELQIVTRTGGVAKLDASGSQCLVPEMDGVRVLGPFTHEMIQKVPAVTQKIFSINSTQPGSYLMEASKQFDKKSHTSYDYIHLVREQLETGVDQCLDAAGFEWNPQVQKSLLRAARLGRSFVPDAATSKLVHVCRVLRLLNALRNSRIAIPLTYAQLNHLRFRTVVDRLVFRRYYKVAIEIADYLKMPEPDGVGRILAHWACYKVKQTQVDEEKIADEIAEKLKEVNGVTVAFSEIASQAINAGRTQLALKLLDYEPEASLQVPLLLKLNQRKPALERAIRSGDTDLILCVMLSVRETMALGDFQLLVRGYPLAQNLYIKHCRSHFPETLRDIYVQEDDHIAQAEFFLRDYFEPTTSSKEVSLNSAVECYVKGKQDFMAGICKDQQKLLNSQKTLKEKFGRDFVGKSLHDTIQMLLEMHEVKLAEKLKGEYKVPDRRFWWIRIQTMADMGEWAELEAFSKSKKSPVGYEPFVDVCLSHKNMTEVKKYLPRVRDEMKFRYYLRAGQLDEAADCAFEQRDPEALRFVLNNGGAQNPQVAAKINKYLMQVNVKK